LVLASRLRLPLAPLSAPQPRIFWHDGACLQRIVDLPRGALSGPIQEDKARAHAALTRLVRKESVLYPAIDLRQIDGLSGQNPDDTRYATLEAFAATPGCRQLPASSHKDLLRTPGNALPRFASTTPLELRQASWLGDRLD